MHKALFLPVAAFFLLVAAGCTHTNTQTPATRSEQGTVMAPGEGEGATAPKAGAPTDTPTVASTSKNLTITTDEQYRYFTGNGLPDHDTGAFPNKGNPNAISEQEYNFRVPLMPEKARTTTDLSLGNFGIALNGVVFDPGAAEFWDNDRNSGWQYEALSGAVDLGVDANNAHVQPTGAYHYHGLPTGLIETLGSDDPLLIGFAADGFPFYFSPSGKYTSSYRLKSGTRPSGPGGAYDGSFVQDYEFNASVGNLDTCNGTMLTTNEYPNGTYAYILTEEYPFIPRCFTGTPDGSFEKGPGGAGRPGQGPHNGHQHPPHGHRPPPRY